MRCRITAILRARATFARSEPRRLATSIAQRLSFENRVMRASGGLGDILKHVPMSDDYQRIELITGTARRRRWTTEQKLRIIEASCEPGESVSSVARRHGVAPNLLYQWRRLMAQGGAAAVGSDEPVVGNSEVRRLEERIRELERLLGRKTMGVEILKEALAKAQAKKPSLQLVSRPKDRKSTRLNSSHLGI